MEVVVGLLLVFALLLVLLFVCLRLLVLFGNLTPLNTTVNNNSENSANNTTKHEIAKMMFQSNALHEDNIRTMLNHILHAVTCTIVTRAIILLKDKIKSVINNKASNNNSNVAFGFNDVDIYGNVSIIQTIITNLETCQKLLHEVKSLYKQYYPPKDCCDCKF